jgi:hypothetical protein
MIKLGRNDLCHCGSGKKYKKCHLDSDQREPARSQDPQESPENGDVRGDDLGSEAIPDKGSIDFRKLPEMLRQLSRTGTAKDREASARMQEDVESVLEYMAHQEEIEEAASRLEKYKKEFFALIKDAARFEKLTKALFAEERFVPMHFTAADVQSAFDQVGNPGGLTDDDRTAGILRAAILHIADKPRRNKLAISLNLMLPEFVATGRYMEAWALQSLAFETSEHSDESNIFLFHMFSYGYHAWAAQERACQESLLRQCGLDVERLGSMTPEQIEALYEDPAVAAAAEAMFQANPALREKTTANIREMEMNSHTLLERDDARFLLLAPEEIEPWLIRFNERFSTPEFSQTFNPATSKSQAEKFFHEVILPLFRAMAVEIFTPDRIRRLVADLKKYRRERFAAGDIPTAMLATGTIAYLEPEDSPGDNKFLVNLCFKSIEALVRSQPI